MAVRPIHMTFDSRDEMFRDLALYCEGTTPSSVPFPDRPSAYISKRCADHACSRTFTAVLVQLSTEAWMRA